MSVKVAAVLAGLAAAGAVLAALSSGRNASTTNDLESPFPRVAAHAVTELVIRSRADEVRLSRDGDIWRLKAPVVDAADPRRVEEALAGLARIALSTEPVAMDESAWARYEVADDEVLTAVIAKDGRRLPSLHLGRSGFARIGDDPRIYEVPEFRRDVLERELSEWRDLSVLKLGDDEITAIEVIDAQGRRARADRAPGSEHENARALPADAWVLTAGAEHAEPFDPSVPASLLRYLLALRGADVAEGPAAREAIEEPALRIRLISDSGVRELLLGGRLDTQTALGTSSGERVWLLSHPQAKQLAKGPRQWRHKQVLHADPTGIVAIDVRHGERHLRAVRNSRWSLEHPADATIDARAADAFARRFSPLVADEVAEPGIELPPDAARMVLELRDGETVTLALGERPDGTFVVASSLRRDLLVLHRQRAEALLVDAFGLIGE
jgi:hypothetical protein